MDKPLQEKCGIVTVYSHVPSKQLTIALRAAGGVQHRGLQGAGIAVQTNKGVLTYTGNGHLKDVFTQKIVDKYDKKSTWVFVHCRYGTHGGYDKRNLQPCIVRSQLGTLALVHNGEFADTGRMRRLLKKKYPDDISDTYLFAQLLLQTPGATWEEKLLNVLEDAKGAFSLMIGIGKKVFLIRDKWGVRPMMLGKYNGSWIAASETHALDKIGAQLIREVRRGEIVKIEDNQVTTIKEGTKGAGHFCDFEWAYFSRPDSLLPTHETPEDSIHPEDWLSVTAFRERCGALLAEEQPLKNATFAVGVPDSGIAVTTAFANALHIPYRQMIVRDHFDTNGNQRLFMRDDQKRKIKQKVLGKLSLVPQTSVWKNAKVVIGDDSIVRGNVSAQITKALFAHGVKEVHWIVGFPPVRYRCHLGVSIRTEGELIAARYKGDAARIAKALGATSVRYISPRGFLKARIVSGQLNKPANPEDLFLINGGCGGCVTGVYPIDIEGVIHPQAVK